MASPYLWTPSLEPRTVINSSREVMINEAVALDKEEEDYEAQLHAIKLKNRRAPIIGVYKMRPNEYLDDDLPLIPEDDDDSEYDEVDDDDDEDDDEEEEDLDEDLEELDEEGDDEAEEAPEEPEFLASTEILPPTSPNGDSSMNISMNISEREEFIAIDNEIYVNGSNTHEEPSFNMEE
ncbi:unnamed protein product [Rhizophagus irregularis]|nr:hypothetical protein GLOIN_2v1494016 [Rhizophagus irregularis DAOM 181602=DAOM 197198]CAB4439353.1 unnamed protein product [Rhizophagus irregularis]CAB4464045.1 unnamed protein product [Rhizophagus irregularis]CAB5216348.1 unnamed protein product [Rhizophagus irregularis]